MEEVEAVAEAAEAVAARRVVAVVIVVGAAVLLKVRVHGGSTGIAKYDLS